MNPWDTFADVYDAWVETAAAVTDPNRRFYADRYVETDEPVVELGVGDGRIAVAAALRGRTVIGVDASDGMLALCRARSEAAGVAERVPTMKADFRDFTLERPARLVTIPFHSLGCLPRQADRLACARNVFEQLAPGGRLVLDHFVFDPELARSQAGVMRYRARGVGTLSGIPFVLWVSTSFDWDEHRIDVLVVKDELDDDGVVTRRRMFDVPFSWVDPDELRATLLEAGFEIEALHGDFDGGAFTDDSKHQVWTARRA